ncbi:hypothetical protein CFI00_03025 [Nocardioides sp. S5]|uniref:hypothetical protein n=1 Tax=Nocardioides sp. S5 TaxID=2017486 RepID=UPI001A8F25E4|nr:hypothetical protein [Nocardioides sp. S5]QSR29493.1 hypothetical protein CFI00_03025 [Nocardioides sp. S5]
MSIDAQLRRQLTSAVEDTTVPPGLARGAIAGGRRRRRGRAVAGGLALASVAVVATAVVQLPGPLLGSEGDVASGASADLAEGLEWARSLPQGEAPALPFFGEGGLWSNGQMHDTLGDEVNYGYPPRQVEGGWLVVTGQDEERLGLAVMASDGSLRRLPGGSFVAGVVDTRSTAVSADGRRVAYRDLVVDLDTMDLTELPHRPAGEVGADDYGTEIRIIGFTDDGLVYQGAPFEQRKGSTWLLRDDGTTAAVEPPPDSHISQGGPADVAVRYDYVAGNTDTCMTTYRLRDTTWEEWRSGCMGEKLGEALAVSPGAEWLLTDDLPRVWSIADGRWDRLDMPVGLGRAQLEAQRGGAVWEGDDTFLLPFADRWTGPTSPEPEFVQHVQVVRCSLVTLACERAGDEQYLPVVTTMWSSGQLTFAQP